MTSKIVNRAMDDPDSWVLRVMYESKDGEITDRIVSPIRFIGDGGFLALCLCREEPRMFYLTRCKAFRLVPVHEVLMPVQIVTHQEKSNVSHKRKSRDGERREERAPLHRDL